MSRTLSALSVCMFLSAFAVAQHHATSFTDTTPDQVVAVQQNGTGSGVVSNTIGSVAQPSLTNLPPAGVVGNANSSTGSSVGVLGTSAGSFGFGVVGIVSGTPRATDSPSGVAGFSTSTSGQTTGVQGQVSSPNGVAIKAESKAATGGLGLDVTVESPDGTAARFQSHGGNILVGNGGQFVVDGSGNVTANGGTFNSDLGVGGTVNVGGNLNVPHVLNGGAGNFSFLSGGSFTATTGNFSGGVGIGATLSVNQNVNVGGNLVVSGTKSSIAEVSGGRRVALYAVESPENWFEDFGTAQLHNGKVQVKLESLFAETVNPDLSYHVFLTPNGNCRGLYIAEKTASGFVVRELRGGKSNVSFDYRVVVRRKGYEKQRLAEVTLSAGNRK